MSDDIDAVMATDVGTSSSLRFTKSTDAGVKLYTTVDAKELEEMDYLMLNGRGVFCITVRDPARGTYMLDDAVNSDTFERTVFPLSGEAYREGATFYIEIYPLDTYTMNWVDDITLFGDEVTVTCGPAGSDLYVYFNTYVTGRGVAPGGTYEVAGEPVAATVGEVEGFRVVFEQPYAGTISGTEEIVVSVEDA